MYLFSIVVIKNMHFAFFRKKTVSKGIRSADFFTRQREQDLHGFPLASIEE